MLVRLDESDSRPIFRQVADEIQRALAVGVLRPGSPLPAVRELARELKINANTVQQAYRTLEREGSATVRRGIGTFATQAPPLPRARQMVMARAIAERMLREGFRHGLLASDLMTALQEIAPGHATVRQSSDR